MITIIRTIAIGATVAVLALAPAKTSARGCGGDRDGTACQTSAASSPSPVQLDQFMKTWKPVATSKSGKRTRSVSRSHRSRSHSAVASSRKAADESKVASETKAGTETKVAAAEPTPLAIPTVQVPAVETDGVAVTSFNDVNELDQAAPRIQVVAFNEVNELDLAAPPPPLPAASETVGQTVSSAPTPADNSWIGKLLLAAAGTIAVAGGLRLLVV